MNLQLVHPQVEVPDGHFWEGQFPHLLLLFALLPGPIALADSALGDGALLGFSDQIWLALAIGVPVAHQVLVAALWRAQLCYRTLTRLFGENDFRMWGALFLPLLIARPLTLLGLGLADVGSAGLPWWFAATGSALLLMPALYTGWSIHQYFGIPRALGGDHFREQYRQMPFVRGGAFRWSNNAMYTFAFLGLWAIALATNSRAALAACLFEHAYIWVHWYCIEQADIQVLYGSSPGSG